MAHTTPQQYRALAVATRAIAALVLVAVVAALVIRVALDRPVSTVLPALLLLCVAGAALLVVSGSVRKKADEGAKSP